MAEVITSLQWRRVSVALACDEVGHGSCHAPVAQVRHSFALMFRNHEQHLLAYGIERGTGSNPGKVAV